MLTKRAIDLREIAPTSGRIWLARGIAMAADAMQMGLFPVFAEGFASPLNMITDVVVAAIMTWLIGWRHYFLPSFVTEMLPIIDLAPSWTLAVLFATRKGAAPPVIDVTEK